MGVGRAVREVVATRRWQRLQDHFSNVLGLTLRTVSPSRHFLTTPSWPPHAIPDQLVGLLKIGTELESLLPPQALPYETVTFTTSLGLLYAAVPIRVTSHDIIAYFVIGPVVVGVRDDEARFHQRASALGMDADAVWTQLLTLKPYTFFGIRSVLNLLEEVGTALAQFAYQANELGTLFSSTDRVSQAMATYYTEQILRALLEVATMATRADGGSVMFYDEEDRTLHIKAAQGLSEEVVANTRVKQGESIAGIAIAQRTVLLLDDATTDLRLRPLMTRPELVSSLVAPLMAESNRELIGVLNLRTANPARRFTQEHVELLHRLLTLTGIALSNLGLTFSKPPVRPA